MLTCVAVTCMGRCSLKMSLCLSHPPPGHCQHQGGTGSWCCLLVSHEEEYHAACIGPNPAAHHTTADLSKPCRLRSTALRPMHSEIQQKGPLGAWKGTDRALNKISTLVLEIIEAK